MTQPRLVVFSILFPHPGQPNAGVFIRERMFRVGQKLPLVVVAPVPWFPFQGIIRKWRPHFRPPAPRFETQEDFDVYHPRFLSLPGLFKSLDGLFMALGSLGTLWRLRRQFNFDLIDAHFAYPDGYAASLLGKWFRVPITITLRGTEVPLSRSYLRRRLMIKALNRANTIFSVAEALRGHAMKMGIGGNKIRVIGNGVDIQKFQPLPKEEARRQLGLPDGAPVIISVGGLVERKGFHRVIECLPALRQIFPHIQYLIVGGASAEGNMEAQLKQQVRELGLEDTVHFLGTMPSHELKMPLSAADVFVLATRNEGWANVFLEAMACGLPVVTTKVGGNAEVVANKELGILVPFGDNNELKKAIFGSLQKKWNIENIIAYAKANSWDNRIAVLSQEFSYIFDENT